MQRMVRERAGGGRKLTRSNSLSLREFEQVEATLRQRALVKFLSMQERKRVAMVEAAYIRFRATRVSKVSSVTIIQRTYRVHVARAYAQLIGGAVSEVLSPEKMDKLTHVQSLMRGRQARQMYAQQKSAYKAHRALVDAERRQQEGLAAMRVQSLLRGKVARGMANQLVLERDAALASQRDCSARAERDARQAARDQTDWCNPLTLERVAEEAKQEDLERVRANAAARLQAKHRGNGACAGRGASGEVVADAKHELANGRDEGSEAMAPAARRAAPHGSADRWLAPGEEVKTVRPKAGAESCTTVTAVHVPPPAVHARSTRGPRAVHACLSNAVMLNQPSVESKPQISFPCGRMWS